MPSTSNMFSTPGTKTSLRGTSSSSAVDASRSVRSRPSPAATMPPATWSASWSIKSTLVPAAKALRNIVWFWRPFHVGLTVTLGLAASNSSKIFCRARAWFSPSFHIDQKLSSTASPAAAGAAALSAAAGSAAGAAGSAEPPQPLSTMASRATRTNRGISFLTMRPSP